MRTLFLVTFAFALSPLACGARVIDPGGNGGSGPGSSLCPATEPKGGACTAPDGFRCTYGEEVRPECRHEWVCGGGHWTTTKSVCLSPPPDHCAFTEPPIGTCNQEGDVCVVGAVTICQCSSCFGGPCQSPPATWHCTAPPTTAGCPPIVPNDGSACDAEGVQCTYGNVCSSSGALVNCKDGLWAWDRQIACAQ